MLHNWSKSLITVNLSYISFVPSTWTAEGLYIHYSPPPKMLYYFIWLCYYRCYDYDSPALFVYVCVYLGFVRLFVSFTCPVNQYLRKATWWLIVYKYYNNCYIWWMTFKCNENKVTLTKSTSKVHIETTLKWPLDQCRSCVEV